MSVIRQKKFAHFSNESSAVSLVLDSTPVPGNTLIIITGATFNLTPGYIVPSSPTGWTIDASNDQFGTSSTTVAASHRTVLAGDTSTLKFGPFSPSIEIFVEVWEITGTPALAAYSNVDSVSPSGQIEIPSVAPASGPDGGIVMGMLVAPTAAVWGGLTPSTYEEAGSDTGGATWAYVAAMAVDGQGITATGAVVASYTPSGGGGSKLWAYVTVEYTAPSTAIVSLETQPGFFDISDSVLACLNPLADYDLIKIKYNADLAAVRPEFSFLGYYASGNTLPLPVSPADGYGYQLKEMLYFLGLASTQSPLPGFEPGQETVPGFQTSTEPVDGFLCDPYQLRPDFGNLTSQGISVAEQVSLISDFYEHGNSGVGIAQQAYNGGVVGVYGLEQRKSDPMTPILPGAVLTTESTPVFYDLPDSAIYDGAPITDQMMQAISRNAKLGVFRFEIFFMGYYRNADTVPLPYGAGGYAYSRAECTMVPLLASSRQPSGDFTPGQILFPSLADLDVYAYPGTAFPEQLSIDPSTGQVTCTIEGASGVEGQGTIAVFCLAQRYPSLTMASQPVWREIANADLVGGQVPTASLLQQLNENAKFGIVAKEAQFLGYFKNGDTLPAPSSPVDGYTYQFHETLYIPVWASSKPPAGGFVSGQKTFPSLGSNLGSGTITASPYQCFINQYKTPTGKLTLSVWQGGVQNQGVAAVYAIGTRQQNPTGTTLG